MGDSKVTMARGLLAQVSRDAKAAAEIHEEEVLDEAATTKGPVPAVEDPSDRDLDAAIAEESNEPSVALRLLYFGVAVLVTSLPAYIWINQLGMSLQHRGIVLVVTIGSSLIVMFAYHCVAHQTVIRLAQRNVAVKAKEEGVRQRQILRRLERKRQVDLYSVAFSLFYN